jgi:hypothetical protein
VRILAYERGLFNQILGEQDPQSAHGVVTYYTPLRPGGIKTYANDYNNFTCDHGSGMESQTKFADSIYFRSADALYVNLFIALAREGDHRPPGHPVSRAACHPAHDHDERRRGRAADQDPRAVLGAAGLATHGQWRGTGVHRESRHLRHGRAHLELRRRDRRDHAGCDRAGSDA